jgi:hypothetical protein
VTTKIIKRCPDGYELVIHRGGRRGCAKRYFATERLVLGPLSARRDLYPAFLARRAFRLIVAPCSDSMD